MDLILAALTVAYILLVWFQSNALESYIKLFKLDKILFVNYFYGEKLSKDNGKEYGFANLREFIAIAYNGNFITKLILCPICLSIWLSIPYIFILGFKLWIPISFLSCLLYFYIANLIKRLYL